MTDPVITIAPRAHPRRPREEQQDLVGLDEDVALELGRLSDGWGVRLSLGHPKAELMAGVARTLVEAGFALHDCAAQTRTGGVCLTPVDQGVVVTWTTHHALSHDLSRVIPCTNVVEIMNDSLAVLLHDAGWCVQPFGTASAHVVPGRRVRP